MRPTFAANQNFLAGEEPEASHALEIRVTRTPRIITDFIKVVADAKYGEILGVHIIGPYATEIIAEAVTAIELEATVEEMMFTIHAHPTVAEALLDGFSSVEGMAVNV